MEISGSTPVPTLWHRLPSDLVDRVLAYNGTLRKRAGKYMNQLAKTDPRYRLLQTVPRIVYVPSIWGPNNPFDNWCSVYFDSSSHIRAWLSKPKLPAQPLMEGMTAYNIPQYECYVGEFCGSPQIVSQRYSYRIRDGIVTRFHIATRRPMNWCEYLWWVLKGRPTHQHYFDDLFG